MSVAQARALLGISPNADAAALRAAFRKAAKSAHPDAPGGDAARFRAVIEAHKLLQAHLASPIVFPPAVAPQAAAGAEEILKVRISPVVAVQGGKAEVTLADGRRLRLTLPAGLREGDKVCAGRRLLKVVVAVSREMFVRGDDVWLTAKVAPSVLAEGGRTFVDTPLGRRHLWISGKDADRRLSRLVGQGLPARGRNKEGDLYLRLEPAEGAAESPARTLLRRFAAAWAA
jgi:curved DNA-binding protein